MAVNRRVAGLSPAAEPNLRTVDRDVFREENGSVVRDGSGNDVEGLAERDRQLAILPRAVREHEIQQEALLVRRLLLEQLCRLPREFEKVDTRPARA